MRTRLQSQTFRVAPSLFPLRLTATGAGGTFRRPLAEKWACPFEGSTTGLDRRGGGSSRRDQWTQQNISANKVNFYFQPLVFLSFLLFIISGDPPGGRVATRWRRHGCKKEQRQPLYHQTPARLESADQPGHESTIVVNRSTNLKKKKNTHKKNPADVWEISVRLPQGNVVSS